MIKRIMKLCLVAILLAAMAGAHAETDMLAVDHRLYELGYRDAACNGILDEVTVNALKNFQIVNGLPATGDPDAATVRLLLSDAAIAQADYLNAQAQENAAYAPLANGSYGEAVTRLQGALKQLGFFSAVCDGAYGDETEAAVYRFQLANGLNETGVADSAVFVRLYEGEPIGWEDFLSESCASVGDSGDHVRRLQIWLKQKGFFSGECTGSYGDGTLQAVTAFQASCDLEQSGDLDLQTCRKLYTDVRAFLRDRMKLRRGDTGAAAEQLCQDLAKLGYPAHARFNMQSELALMQFQLVNKLDVSGVADEITLVRLHSENAVARDDYAASRKRAPEDEGLGQRLSRKAGALLGQYSELDDYFGFVQYVALSCDVELMDFDQLKRVEIGSADSIPSGAFLGVQIGDTEIMGVAISERAIVYRAENGYIVMNYLDRMEAEQICIYHLADER